MGFSSAGNYSGKNILVINIQRGGLLWREFHGRQLSVVVILQGETIQG